MSRQLGEFEQLLLFALLELEDDAHGVQVRRVIEERTGRESSPGAVYTALSRLEKRGFVSSRLGDQEEERGGRPRRFYALEPEGARILEESFRRLTNMADGLLTRLDRAVRQAR